MSEEILFKTEVYEIIGAAIQVQKELGHGFLEAVYLEAFEVELTRNGIPFESQKQLQILYRGEPLSKTYVADLICYDSIIVELKALNQLSGSELSQVLNYLKATQLRLGLLINFGHPGKLEWKRVIL